MSRQQLNFCGNKHNLTFFDRKSDLKPPERNNKHWLIEFWIISSIVCLDMCLGPFYQILCTLHSALFQLNLVFNNKCGVVWWNQLSLPLLHPLPHVSCRKQPRKFDDLHGKWNRRDLRFVVKVACACCCKSTEI